MSEPFLIARTAAGGDVLFRPSLANRHGLVTGATGTGKTVTLQTLADHFSQIGVPVFVADVKGDLSGVGAAGAMSPKLTERLKSTGIPEPAFAANPVVFWDVFGKRGFPIRATVSSSIPTWTNCSSVPSAPITPSAAYWALAVSRAAPIMSA